MEKPNNYDETQAAGDYTPFKAGPHYLVIRQVIETQSKAGKPMLKIFFDTTAQDEQPEYFSKAYKANTRPDKKWPFDGTAYIVTEDNEGKCSRNFKGFTTSVEKSNPGFAIQWGAGFADSLKGKLVGATFRMEIGVYNGKETRHTRFAWFIPNSDVITARVPDPIETKEYQDWREESNSGTTYMEDDDDDLPFA